RRPGFGLGVADPLAGGPGAVLLRAAGTRPGVLGERLPHRVGDPRTARGLAVVGHVVNVPGRPAALRRSAGTRHAAADVRALAAAGSGAGCGRAAGQSGWGAC